MKKVFIACFVIIILVFACSKKQNNPLSTDSLTRTPTQTTVPCVNPAIGGFDSAAQYSFNFPYYFDYASGIINVKIYAEAGKQLKAAIYDGLGNKLAWNDSSFAADSNGYFTRNYTIASVGNTLSPWHIAVVDFADNPPLVYNPSDAVFLDTQTVHVAEPAPTPVPPSACVNEPLLFCDPNHTIQKYEFKNKNCVRLFYTMGYCYGFTEANIAYYDGNDDLVFVDIKSVDNYTVSSAYTVDTSKISGTWHIILYDSAYTPPLKFNTSSPYHGTCPPYITCKIE